jgi:hypothetical protein
LASVEGLKGFSGIGFVLTGDGLGGVDLDHCRDPETGKIAGWALDIIGDFASYTEVSPSGCGVKILARGAPDTLPGNVWYPGSIWLPPGGGDGEKVPHADVYLTGRYFTITGDLLEGLPEEIQSSPNAWRKLSRLLAEYAKGKAKTPKASAPPSPAPKKAPAEPAPLWADVFEAMRSSESVLRIWEEGGREPNDKSSNDAALASAMARAGFEKEARELALRAYPLGQIGGGKLTGKEAERQVQKLLDLSEPFFNGPEEVEFQPWPEAPEALADSDPDPLPVELMPKALGDHIRSVSEALQIPQDFTAAIALGVVSASLAGKVEVHARPYGEWIEPVQLWTGAIMPSGARKSPTFSQLVKPLADWEAETMRARREEIAHAQNMVQIAEETLAKSRKDRVNGKGSDFAVRDAQRALSAAQDSLPPSGAIVISNATPESLTKELERAGGRGAILEPEPGLFNSLLSGLYSGGSPQLDEINKAYTGERILVQRISRASVDIPRPSLTVAVCIQPGVLDGLENRGAMRAQGTLARFLWVQPRDTVGHRKVGRMASGMDREAKASYSEMIRALLNAPAEEEGRGGEMTPWKMSLTPEAREILDDFEEWLEPTLRVGNENEPIRDWASKAAGRALRIAALLELASRPGRESSFNLGGALPAWAMEAGVAFTRAALSHARDVMGGTSPEERNLERLLSACVELCKQAQEERKEATVRELHQKVRRWGGSAFTAKTSLDVFLNQLKERGLIQTAKAPGKGGRASEVFRVHPHLLGEQLLPKEEEDYLRAEREGMASEEEEKAF